MFDNVSIDEISKHITFTGKSSVFKEDNTIPELQAKGVTALCKILSGRQYAYLADEVGMGKTYQAIGVIAMLLAEKKNANILIVAPNEAVQRNWRNEIDNFLKNNLLFDAKLNLEKDVEVTHPIDIIHNYALERRKVKISIVRLTAFSTIGERVTKHGDSSFSYKDKILSRKLCQGIAVVTGHHYESIPYEEYDSKEAGMICGSIFRRFSPQYDLVIVDEAQNIRNENNATAFFNFWMGLKKCKVEPETKVGKLLGKYEKEAPKKRSKYLLLSATPAHRGVESLRKQLQYFENPKNIPVIDHEYLEQFMIRRLRTYSGSNKYAVRNITADDVAKDIDVEKRLFLALVQSKLAQVQAANNATFKIGFLETFESYDVKADEQRVDDETGEKGKEFENGGSSKPDEKGAALDKDILKNLAKSYSKAFNVEKCPPHPKLDFMADEIGKYTKTNLFSGTVTEGPDKSIIFVRRLASVDELVNHRLNRRYEDSIISYWGNRFGIKDAKLIEIQKAFEALYKKTTVEEDDEDITEETSSGEEGGLKSQLIAWMSVKKSDKGNHYSSVSLFKKSMMRNKPNSYLFDENYYRTAHADDNDDRYKKRIKKLVDADFAKEISDYIQADFSRYIQLRSESRQLNNSYLLVLCCYVALAKEQHPLAEKIRQHFNIADKVESDEAIINERQIVRILNQTSLWNCLKRGDKKSAEILEVWFNTEKFGRREALKSWAEKYLKSSEAILEILYCYCNLRDKNNRHGLCMEVWKALYSQNCSHGIRIRQLFCEDNANLVCNQLLGGTDIDYTYDPAFMNNQQWVMPATGGNKGNEALIKRFNTPFYPDVIVCTDVLKEGINLHLFCNRVYHYGLAWTPGDLEQRIGRVDRFFSKTHRERLAKKNTHVEIDYPYMGKSVDEQQLRKVLQFKLSADPLLDSNGTGRKDIELDLTDNCTIEDLVKFVPLMDNQTNLPYSGELFWGAK